MRVYPVHSGASPGMIIIISIALWVAVHGIHKSTYLATFIIIIYTRCSCLEVATCTAYGFPLMCSGPCMGHGLVRFFTLFFVLTTICCDCLVCLQKALSKSGEKSSLKCYACRQVHSCDNGTGTGLWFPNHSMVEIIAKMASKSKFFCPVHQHDMNYYCFDDHAMVCIYCAYHGEHSSHDCKHVEEAKKEADACLRKVKVSISNHVSEMERRLQFVKDEREMLKSQETSIRQVIEDSYEKLKSVLLRQRELLFQELQDQTADIGSGIDLSVK